MELLEVIKSKIYVLPKRPPFMVDKDVAEFYEVSTKRLNQQAERNRELFPRDFRFQLTEDEAKNLRLQNATAKFSVMERYLPWSYTRHGCNMAAYVLKTPRARERAVDIVRVFSEIEERIQNELSDQTHKIMEYFHKELATGDDKEMERILYQGKLVVTFKKIDEFHHRPEGTARRTFHANIKDFQEGQDYFSVPYEIWSQIAGLQESSSSQGGNRSHKILLSERCYLKVIKHFTDDQAWEVWGELLPYYYETRQIPGEAHISLDEYEKVKDEHEKVKDELLRFKDKYINVLEAHVGVLGDHMALLKREWPDERDKAQSSSTPQGSSTPDRRSKYCPHALTTYSGAEAVRRFVFEERQKGVFFETISERIRSRFPQRFWVSKSTLSRFCQRAFRGDYEELGITVPAGREG